VVSKQKQKTSGCAGVKSYPVNSFNEGNLMDTDEYRYLSEDISESLHAHTLMDEFERITVLFSDDSDEDQTAIENTMDSIKTALNNGNRVTFGAFLVLAPSCSVGACVSNKQTQDTWAITNEVRQTHENDRFAVGGHEMVITGYDDTATVIDKNGMTHTGLLKLRNSWGEEVGDSGNFYMTYEYFKKFALEAHEVVNLNMSSKK
jgi:peptidase C1-like protein